jgi:hypothetical protein
MTERDDFDKIVEGLELDLSFIDETPEPVDQEPTPPVRPYDESDADEDEEPFYRKVEPTHLVPRRRSVLLAWVGVLGAPLALVVATISGVVLDRPIVAAASLTFVGAAIYLILQLPEHGPSRRDWPDDGAVL